VSIYLPKCVLYSLSISTDVFPVPYSTRSNGRLRNAQLLQVEHGRDAESDSSGPINPSLSVLPLNSLEGNTGSTTPTPSRNGDTSNSDNDTDSDFDYYRLAKKAVKKVCPFSDTSRENPCASHSTPRVRKDAIKRHLENIKRAGGDGQHPIGDPLWDSPIVNYMLVPRPPRFDDKKRKAGSRSSAQRYYKKRKHIQETQAEPMKTLYIEGKIAPDDYKKYLIGNKRREFIMELKVKAQIEKDLRLENEGKLRVEIEKKLQELHVQRQAGRGTEESEHASASIIALEAAQKDLKETRSTVEAYREVLSTQASNVVQIFANDDFLLAGLTFLEYHCFSWPSSVSADSFYQFATMLTPSSQWENRIRSPSSLRHMKKELHDYIQAEKDNVDESDTSSLEAIMAVFNSCCDLIRSEESKTEKMSADGAQHWLDEQDALWEAAKQAYHRTFKFNACSPLQLVRMIDTFADTWRAQKNAELENEEAMQTAQEKAGQAL
jgi:hypothetical protein